MVNIERATALADKLQSLLRANNAWLDDEHAELEVKFNDDGDNAVYKYVIECDDCSHKEHDHSHTPSVRLSSYKVYLTHDYNYEISEHE